MIRSYFGLTDNPFSMREIQLLPHQQEIHDTLRVHCQQGGLCASNEPIIQIENKPIETG